MPHPRPSLVIMALLAPTSLSPSRLASFKAENFRPHPSRLWDYCAYKAHCPAFGGDPALTGREPVPAGAG